VVTFDTSLLLVFLNLRTRSCHPVSLRAGSVESNNAEKEFSSLLLVASASTRGFYIETGHCYGDRVAFVKADGS
jgi:hypothetical protein